MKAEGEAGAAVGRPPTPGLYLRGPGFVERLWAVAPGFRELREPPKPARPRWFFPAWKVLGFALSNTHEALLSGGPEAPIPSVYVVVYCYHHGRTL